MRLTLIVFFFALCPVYGQALAESAPPIQSVVVFPFENQSGRTELNWISESFAEVLQARLSSPGRFAFTREERQAGHDLVGLPAGVSLTLASFYKVAETLDADWAVTGSFEWDGETLAARTRLFNIRTPNLSHRLEERGPLHKLIEVQSRLAWRLVKELEPEFRVAQSDFVRRFPKVRLNAFENLIRGLIAGDWDTQLKHFTRAYGMDPQDRRAAFELGRLYFADKKYKPSLEWLKKLRKGDDRYWESKFLQGAGYFLLEETAKAESVFRDLARQVRAPEVLNNLGVLDARNGKQEEALGRFQAALDLDPDDDDIHFNLALLYWKRGDRQRARDHVRESLRVNEEDGEARAFADRLDEESEYGEHSLPPKDTEVGWRLKVEYNPGAFRPGRNGAGSSEALPALGSLAR